MSAEKTMVKMVFDRWFTLVKNLDEILDSLPDDELQKEIAPGKNRGIYLLGHLTAVHDSMLPLMDLGNKLYPGLAKPFLESPDKTVADLPAAKTLRAQWKEVNQVLARNFENLPADAWFQKHTSVSAEDFMKEPHRNKLNIVLTRASHLAYHLGQFVLLKKKAA
jgi:hypothetical protein